jgi:hypothetical protein
MSSQGIDRRADSLKASNIILGEHNSDMILEASRKGAPCNQMSRTFNLGVAKLTKVKVHTMLL